MIYKYYPFEDSKVRVVTTESTGSGELPINLTVDAQPIYHIKEMTSEQIEQLFKEKYPLQYKEVKKRFNKKLKKLLKANEGEGLM